MPLKSIKTIIPWWFKICSKIIVSRLPIQHKFWKFLNLFEHGSMENPNYAYSVLSGHFDKANQEKVLPEEFVCLELGPGESLFSALISRSFGAKKTYLVDVANFASQEVETYQAMADFLKQKNLPLPEIEQATSVPEVMEICSASYLTSGISSLKSIEDNSVDFVWSHAVLEHVKRSDFIETMKEIRRVIRKDGVCTHVVDLRDHLDNSLHNLRFSEKIWESSIMANSGFYTNRIQYSQMLDIFKQAGFAVKSTELKKWDSLPLNRSQLDKQFSSLPEEELCIYDFSVVLQPV